MMISKNRINSNNPQQVKNKKERKVRNSRKISQNKLKQRILNNKII